MAGFFGIGDFTKEGPGVSKDAPTKAKPLLFFDLLLRKFWQLIRINIMYLIFNIPGIILAIIITFAFLLPYLLGNALNDQEIINELFGGGVGLLIIVLFFTAMTTAFPIITTGPSHAGLTFILRNYSREEHAFIWSDFKEHARKNLKQSIIVSLINMVLFVLIVFQLYFYNNYTGLGNIRMVAVGLLIVLSMLYLMMIMYIYPLMITFNLTIKQLYKNAFIFALLKFFPNLIILIICFGFIFATFYFQPLIGVLLYPLVTVSLINFIINFYVYPKLKKYIIDKMEDDEKVKENENEIEPEFKDTV